MDKKYKLTSNSAMQWAKHELDHIGRIVSVEDPDIQYSYAMSTLYGMFHLKNALTELVNDSAYSVQREDLQRTLSNVVRAIKHLIKDFSLDLTAIQSFNTKKILGDLSEFRPVNTRQNEVRNTRNVRNMRNVRNVNKMPNRRNTAKNAKPSLLGLGVFGL